MNTEIQKGLVEPNGYGSLANAVGARLLVEVPSWTGVVWRPEGVQLAHQSNRRRLENLRSWIAFSAAALEEMPPYDELTNLKRLD